MSARGSDARRGERFLRQVRRGTARATRPRAKNAYDTPFERLCVLPRHTAKYQTTEWGVQLAIEHINTNYNALVVHDFDLPLKLIILIYH